MMISDDDGDDDDYDDYDDYDDGGDVRSSFELLQRNLNFNTLNLILCISIFLNLTSPYYYLTCSE
jgi:hypothetical protein